jgi:hypothetical protein
MGLHPGSSEKITYATGGESSFREAHPYGKGQFFVVRRDPKELVMEKDGHALAEFLELVNAGYARLSGVGKLKTKNYFYLERGPYTIASVMDESVSSEPLSIKGPVIDLFDPALPVLAVKLVRPGEQAFLYDLSRAAEKGRPAVLCAASRVYEEASTDHSYSFLTRSPSGTRNSMRIKLPAAPTGATITGPGGQVIANKKVIWDAPTNTCLLQFENDCDGIRVRLDW